MQALQGGGDRADVGGSTARTRRRLVVHQLAEGVDPLVHLGERLGETLRDVVEHAAVDVP